MAVALRHSQGGVAQNFHHNALADARGDNRWSDKVVLVGHSLGGVLAVQTLIDTPDLTPSGSPFVKAVVAIDAPFEGSPHGHLWPMANARRSMS
jgi:pimeloyl-ACP methyl ester carboxylesterase